MGNADEPGGAMWRDMLVADLALAMGVAGPVEVVAALRTCVAQAGDPRTTMDVELQRGEGVDAERLAGVVRRAEALIERAEGDARQALLRHGSLDRSIHTTLAEVDPASSRALATAGARVRAPIPRMRPDRYVGFELAGEGGMGIVYVALDTDLSRQVAFKVVRPPGGEGREAPATPERVAPPSDGTRESGAFEELTARFLQEAWVTGGLEHPGVVPVYELGHTEAGVPYYTMRFVQGQRTLGDEIEDAGGSPMEERLGLLEPFLKMCDTVRYAHARGVVHRDLKPENVALGPYGEVVVLDWGLAKFLTGEDPVEGLWQARVEQLRTTEDLQSDARALGTPGYMAPEAAIGATPDVDAQSDVYSLGAILYEVLTGRLPHAVRGSYADYARRVTTEEPVPAHEVDEGVPRALSELCAAALARTKAARPASVEVFVGSIRTWQKDRELEREIEGRLREARGALEAARALRGDGRLRTVQTAAGALERIDARRPGLGEVRELRARAEALRARGLGEHDAASRRRALVRFGVAALALFAVGAAVAVWLIEDRRRAADEARNQAVVERNAKAAALQVAEQERAAKQAALDDARDAHDKAEAALKRVLRLADSKALREVIEQEKQLWPVQPAQVERMEGWIRAARTLLSRRAAHRAALDEVEARALPYTSEQKQLDHAGNLALLAETRAVLQSLAEDMAARKARGEVLTQRDAFLVTTHRSLATQEVARLAAELEKRLSWKFESPEDAWVRTVLKDILADLDRLEDPAQPEAGLLAAVRHRAEEAVRVGKASIEDHADAWRRTIQALGDVEQNPRYEGLALAPQVGLVPLGKDPASGLFEFAHVGSGTLPRRDEATGKLVLADDAAIVLVLFPRGSFFMGAQATDPKGRHYDPQAEPMEAPVHEVHLTPFFLAKHECTQAQWRALTGGSTPSRFAVVQDPNMPVTQPASWRQPVEQVSWSECRAWLFRRGLTLPAEAQWEYACRAGTDTPWGSGVRVADLGKVANISDAYLRSHGAPPEWPCEMAVNDGHGTPAPVGSYEPNAFGLHDMHGNVSEWCSDSLSPYPASPVTNPTGLPAHFGGKKVFRGGGWVHVAHLVRSSLRRMESEADRDETLGVRPARALDR